MLHIADNYLLVYKTIPKLSSWISLSRSLTFIVVHNWFSMERAKLKPHVLLCTKLGTTTLFVLFRKKQTNRVILPFSRFTRTVHNILSQLMRVWYLSHRRTATAQARLRICTVSPEPSLFAHLKYRSRRRIWPKIRRVIPLDGCACAFEDWVYGGR